MANGETQRAPDWPDWLREPAGPGPLSQGIGQIAPMILPIMSMLNFNPEQWAVGKLTGDPNAYLQSQWGGNNRIADIYAQEAQDAFFKVGSAQQARDDMQQRALSNYYRRLGYSEDTVRQKVASTSDYSPTGMISSYLMDSFNFEGMQREFTKGFMNMGMVAIDQGGETSGMNAAAYQAVGGTAQEANEFMNRQKRNIAAGRRFADVLSNDYARNPSGYGGLDAQQVSQVFSQMTSRNIIGLNDIMGATETEGDIGQSAATGKDIPQRVEQTKQRVKDMSRAVASMQELFGGTIPQVLDQMDGIFGGSAGAMGGAQLERRVLEIKQTAMVSGQSFESVGRMISAAQGYATQAGVDRGVGTQAALQTSLQIGGSYAGGGFNVRRVDREELRLNTLRANVAGAAGPLAQQYAGALSLYLQRNEGATSEDFAQLVRKNNVSDLAGLARITGASTNDIQMMSRSEAAMIAMSDDPTVARFGSQAVARRATGYAISVLQADIANATGVQVAADQFTDAQGNLRGSDDLIKRLSGMEGISNIQAQSIVNNALESAGQNLGLGNAATFQAYLRQQRQSDELRRVRDMRTNFNVALNDKKRPGGARGVLNLLANGTAEEMDQFGEIAGAFFGSISTDEMEAGVKKAKAMTFATNVQSFLTGDKGSVQDRERLALITTAMTSGEMLNLSKEDSKKFMELAAGPVTTETIKAMADLVGPESYKKKQEIADLLGTELKTAGKSQDELREISVKAAIRKTEKELGRSLGASEEELLKGLTTGDRSIGDIYKGIEESDKLSLEDKKKLKENVASTALTVGAAPAQANMPEIFSRLVEVMQRIETKLD